MTHPRRLLVVAILAISALGGCERPSDVDCRKAIENMQMLLGTDKIVSLSDIEGEVRRCKGGSKKPAVQCAIKATSLDELRACAFMKVPDKK